MVSKKCLFVLLAGVSIFLAPALFAQPGTGGERVYSPLTAETFHRIAREVSTDAIGEKDPAAEAMAFLIAAMDLDEGELPLIEDGGKRVRIIAGALYGKTSPVRAYSGIFYADARLDAGASLPLDAEHEERGLYLVSGEIDVAGEAFQRGKGRLVLGLEFVG